MKKWIIRKHRSSPYMLFQSEYGKWWTRDIEEALKFDTRMAAVQTAHKAYPGEFVVMEIECP